MPLQDHSSPFIATHSASAPLGVIFTILAKVLAPILKACIINSDTTQDSRPPKLLHMTIPFFPAHNGTPFVALSWLHSEARSVQVDAAHSTAAGQASYAPITEQEG